MLLLKSYRQQVTDHSCGAVAAMTGISYYGLPVNNTDADEVRVDGITYFNYGEFDAMWFNAHYFPENMKDRVWVVAVPANATRPA